MITMMDDKNDDGRDDDDKTFIKRSFPSQEFKLPMHVSDWSVRLLFPRYSPSYYEMQLLTNCNLFWLYDIF